MKAKQSKAAKKINCYLGSLFFTFILSSNVAFAVVEGGVCVNPQKPDVVVDWQHVFGISSMDFQMRLSRDGVSSKISKEDRTPRMMLSKSSYTIKPPKRLTYARYPDGKFYLVAITKDSNRCRGIIGSEKWSFQLIDGGKNMWKFERQLKDAAPNVIDEGLICDNRYGRVGFTGLQLLRRAYVDKRDIVIEWMMNDGSRAQLSSASYRVDTSDPQSKIRYSIKITQAGGNIFRTNLIEEISDGAVDDFKTLSTIIDKSTLGRPVAPEVDTTCPVDSNNKTTEVELQ